MLRKLTFGLVFGLFFAGCGFGYQSLKDQADDYAALIAENQLALGRLIQQHHALEEHLIEETCTPRAF